MAFLMFGGKFMYVCPNCNKQSETPANFCPVCGTTMIIAPTPQTEAPEQPVYAEPQYAQPQYGQPQYGQPQYAQPQYGQPQQPIYNQPQYNQPMYVQPQYVAPQPSTPSKAKAIVGMALGAAGLFSAVTGFLYTMIGMAIDGGEAGLFMAIFFGFFSIPLSLVGLIMSAGTRKAGDTTIFSKLGKIFGLIGVILSGVTLLIGSVGLDYTGSSYDDYDYYDYY